MRRLGADYRGIRVRTTPSTYCTAGQATLVAGTVTVSNTYVQTGDLIFLTVATAGGTLGIQSVGTLTSGTSFVINSSNAADTSVINWVIMRPENIV